MMAHQIIKKMKNKSLIFLIFVSIMFIAQSCYYDKSYVLSPGAEPCDTTSFAYAADINPIMIQYCVDCHSTEDPSDGVILDTYEGVKLSVDDGGLLGSITHESGFSAMPKNAPKLDPCTIRIIELWVDDGAPEN